MKISFLVALAVATVAFAAPPHDLKDSEKFYRPRECSGSAKYKVTITNFLTGDGTFKGIIPEGGLVFSPLTGAGHSTKISLAVLRSFPSDSVIRIAEAGDNSELLAEIPALTEAGLVKSAAAAEGPTMPGTQTELEFEVDCERPYISVVGMLAPSPDWVVAVSNFMAVRYGRFVEGGHGFLFVYDAGTDAGPAPPASIFTDPMDFSLDVPQEPRRVMHPLAESEEDPGFNGRAVGKYVIQRVA